MQPTATHYENANFLRELAESLPRILPKGNPAQAELLQRLAEKADLLIQFQELKKGRSVQSLRFTFIQSPQQSLPLQL